VVWTKILEKVSNVAADIPSGTKLSSGSTVQLTTVTSGADIYYTLDGTTPEADGSNAVLYSGPISITGAVTISAIAAKSGFTPSSVSIFSYTVE
jgi:hypothetical protein